MKLSKFILTASIVGAICLSLVQIVFSSAFATDGITLEQLTAKQQKLETENTLLKEKVYAASSITAIAQKAEQLGYTEDDKSRMTLSSPLPIALNQ